MVVVKLLPGAALPRRIMLDQQNFAQSSETYGISDGYDVILVA
jgi:hypothetical protein